MRWGDIFRTYGDAFRRTHRLSWAQHQAINAIAACRTARLGGHVDQCDSCGTLRISYNSCRNRHCPKCQHLPRQRWLEARKAELLAVKHFHLVFTLPHELHPLIRANEKLCYSLLFQSVAQTVLQLGKEKKIPSCPNGALGRAAYLGAKLDVSPSYPLFGSRRRAFFGWEKVDQESSEVFPSGKSHVAAISREVSGWDQRGFSCRETQVSGAFGFDYRTQNPE